jgi:tRNA1(Val) A37 N6-methylase TrmN6
MSNILDQYYTPEGVANTLLEQAGFENPNSCLDPTCGSGNLLLAVTNIHRDAKCIGIDRDKRLIINLKKRRPEWILSVADLLKANSYLRTSAYSKYATCDALLLNPPFSQGKNKYVNINYQGQVLKGSVAMSYLLKSIEIFSPLQGAMVIAPESLMHSQLDEYARLLLSKDYEFKSICDLENKTFKGARVHAHVFRLQPRNNEIINTPFVTISKNIIKATIERGGIQVHIARNNSGLCMNPVPFVHTTSLNNVTNNNLDKCTKTSLSACGRVKGPVILIPRVGVPKKEYTKIICLSEEVQLSDCLFAIKDFGDNSLLELETRIHDSWDDFVKLYKGTGARYVTISKLVNWFAHQKIHINNNV